jgi:hypothetical protein
MPVFELILSSDTINEGRIKINDAFSATTGLWSGGTGFQSLISNNDTGNIASGDYAIATGSGTTASGDYSFASGINTLASGEGSHAEGGVTFIFGNPIYFGSTASTYGAHAEGISVASGINSHSEGSATIASGNFSHAEGSGTNAIGAASHAEGLGTTSNGTGSHSEGQNTTSIGNYSHTEGTSTTAVAENSHAEGLFTTAVGLRSHSEGSQTTAIGSQSHAGGLENIAFGSNSYTTGNLVIASGTSSFAGGQGSLSSSPIIAQGNVSFAFYEQDATISNYGVLGNNSVILGGKNHFIDTQSVSSSILGGIRNEINGLSVYSTSLSSNNSKISTSTATTSFCNTLLSASYCTIPNDSLNCIITGRGALTQKFTGNTGGYFTIGWSNLPIPTPSTANNTFSIEMNSGTVRSVGPILGGAGSADYAEYFEWLDGNPNNMDRVGYFVSLTGQSIFIGNENVIGVVSASPFIVGDASSLQWKDIWLTDEFGRFISFDYDLYKYDNELLNEFIDSTGDTFVEISQKEFYLVKYETLLFLYENGYSRFEPELNQDIYLSELPNFNNPEGILYTGDTSNFRYVQYGRSKIFNSKYNPKQEYIPREERPEWSPVGLLGKINVRTSEIITGSTVSVDSNGMAINGSDYYVLENLRNYNIADDKYGIVKILFK